MGLFRRIAASRWRFAAIGLPVLAAVIAANHLEYRLRQARLRRSAAEGVVVRMESGALGHTTIGVDEATLSAAGERPFLHFALLGEWAFQPAAAVPCPEPIRAFDGKETRCLGFMYPLQSDPEIRAFCLLRTTQTCCYGPRPQYTQFLLVEMDHPVKFERFAPVLVTGKFFVDPQPDQGYIYRMAATSATAVADDEPDVNPADAARRAGLPLFDWDSLQKMEPAPGNAPAAIPSELKALDGKPVVVEGLVVNRFPAGRTADGRKTPPRLLVSVKWWDGTSLSKAPGIYAAMMATLLDEKQLPPVWKQKAVFTGILRVQDPSAWSKEGVVALVNAVRGVSAAGGLSVRTDPGPFLGPVDEAVLAAIFLYFAWRTGRRVRDVKQSPYS
jgi:hypothetical protein